MASAPRTTQPADPRRTRSVDGCGDRYDRDGFLATFDGLARATNAALSSASAVPDLGLEVRCGVHTGLVEVIGEDVAGLAVPIGAGVGALAGSGEVLVSSTVKDLIAGSGFTFEDRGIHVLKDVPNEWRAFAASR